METKEYGNITSADETSIASAVASSSDNDGLDITPEGNALWSYHSEHRINGIPVDEAARGLKIDRDDMLNVAFRLDRKPCSMLLYMSPDDKESADAYDKLLERVYNGEVFIVDESRQFDAAKCRFVVWIRYDELRYVLHPRFNYLLEE